LAEALHRDRTTATRQGALVGTYRILAQLGEGGMGVVYLAEDTELGRQVALKMVRAEVSRQEAFLGRFLREARLSASLNHPNIVTTYHIGRHEGTPYLAMEYVEGKCLRDLLRTPPPLSVPQVLEYFAQACEGLGAAAARGVIHRDVKPANLMVRRDGVLKVMDFGLARTVENDGLTTTGAIIGTPDYIAPEQIAGTDIDSRADVYSLGLSLFQCIVGFPPFRSSSVMTTLMRQTNEPLPTNPLIMGLAEGRLWKLMLRMTAKRPADREASFTTIRNELRSIAESMVKHSTQDTCVIPAGADAPASRPSGLRSGPPAESSPAGVAFKPIAPQASGSSPSQSNQRRTKVGRKRHRFRGMLQTSALLGGGALFVLAVALLATWAVKPSQPHPKGGGQLVSASNNQAHSSADANLLARPPEPSSRPSKAEGGLTYRTQNLSGTMQEPLVALQMLGLNTMLRPGLDPSRSAAMCSFADRPVFQALEVLALAGGWTIESQDDLHYLGASNQPVAATVRVHRQNLAPIVWPSVTLNTTGGQTTLLEACELFRRDANLDYLLAGRSVAGINLPPLAVTRMPLDRVLNLLNENGANFEWTILHGVLVVVPDE